MQIDWVKSNPGKGQLQLSFFYLAYLILMAAFLSGCDAETTLETTSGPIMGTSYQVKWDHRGVKAEPQAVASDIVGILTKINSLMSTYEQNSELSSFNNTEPGQWFSLSAETLEVFAIAEEVSQQSEGAFDITVGELVNLWGFGPDAKPVKLPKDDQISHKLRQVGYRNIAIDRIKARVLKKTPVFVDLSAVAKGFAVDKIADHLRGLGSPAFLVEVGGELRSFGKKPDGSDWRIAVEAPVVNDRIVHGVIKLVDMGLATSGDYRNFYEENGIRYSHTIDPRTGKPIRHRLASVTVVHPKAAYADAWATALMVLGEQQGYDLAVKNNIAALMLVKEEENFAERTTPAFNEASMLEVQ